MGTTTASMSLQKPTLGGDPGTYDDQLNASLDLLDVHDHTTGKGVKVPTAGLNINADLTFAGFAATNVKAIAFSSQTSYATNKSLWVKTSDGELYWRTNAGTDVKVTSGTSLNLSLVGGITGDYAAAGASLYYDDANQAYRFLEATPLPNSWSRVLCGDLDLYEHASGISNRVRLQSPAALAASYAITLPTALPAVTNTIVQMSNAGAMSSFPTVAPSQTSYLRVSTAGALSVENSWSMAIYGGAGLFAPASNGNTDAGYLTWTGTGNALIPIPLNAGDRITALTVYYSRDSAATLTFSLQSNAMAGAASTSLCSKQIAAGAGASSTQIGSSPTSGSLPQTLAANTAYFFVASCQALDDVYGIVITYDRP